MSPGMKRRQCLQLGALASLPAWAQRGFDTPPPPGPARALRWPALERASLPNGLEIWVARKPGGLPLVTVLLQIGAGSLHDPAGKAGLADLTLAVMAKGARRGDETMDAADLAHAAESLGSALDIEVLPDCARLALTVGTARLEEAVNLLADVACRPTLLAAELERSRAQALDALTLSLADAPLLAGELAQRLFWGETPRGRLATHASLAKLRREDLLACHRQLLRPDSSRLILAGDVELAEAIELAEAFFADWQAPRQPLPALPLLSPQPLAPALLLDLPEAGHCAVLLAAPGPALGVDAAPAQVAQAVLGQGYSSRLNQELRIKRGLSYGSSSQAEALPGAGCWRLGAQTRPERAAEVAQLMRAELLRLAREPVPEAELAARQAALLGELGRAPDTSAGLALLVAEQARQGRGQQALADWPAALRAVRPAQLQALAGALWRPEALRCVVVGDLKGARVEEELRRQWPGAWPLRAQELDLGSRTLRKGA